MDYKEKLEEAKRLYQTANTDQRYVLESLFPELNKESEDEKVRKALIEMVHDTTGDSLWIDYNVHKSEAIAWLEKQGEQKPFDYENANIQQKDFAPKQEPKFKVGDWVIDKQGIVHQIANVIENVTCHTYSYDIVGGGYFNDNTEGVRLWTIQDAKDGDVLACGDKITDCPFIFHNLTDELNPRSYCGINRLQHFQDNDENGGFWCCSDEVRPATKEQRDTLMKAMTDAGWEFDFDKKELKKISQRMVSAEAKEAMYSNPAWSEEDERSKNAAIQACKGMIDYFENSTKQYEDAIDWLESLKQRVGVDLGDQIGDIGVKTVYDSSNSLEISRHGNPHNGKTLEEAAKNHKSAIHIVSPQWTSEVEKAFKAGAEWQKEKACEWLKENKDHPLIGCEDPCLSGYLTDVFIEDFKQAMNK